jgi:hypothetical protein
MEIASTGNDRNNARNKVKFILAWYHLENKKLKDDQKMLLLNKWIKSCTQFEEYEMSNALLNEKRILAREIRVKIVGERTLYKKLILFIKILKRRITNGLRTKI